MFENETVVESNDDKKEMKGYTEEEVKKLAQKYADQENSCYTNDLNGFISGFDKCVELTREEKKKDRFFIAFYNFVDEGGYGFGNSTFKSKGSYLNHAIIEKELNRTGGLTNVTVSNILELSESDYKDWMAK